jgi:cellulose biosynthesis protein BcsQ
MKENKGVIISIANNKGGIGKTTISVNLAEALGNRGIKPLVIDLDPQCNATSLLLDRTITPKKTMYDLMNPEIPEPILTDYIKLSKSGKVWHIPNIPEITFHELPILAEGIPVSFNQLRNKIREQALDMFDVTIIDNRPDMGTFVFNALYASDFVIVPIEAGSSFSMEGLYKAILRINEISEKDNPDLRFLRLLINKLDKRTNISKYTAEMIQNSFEPDQVFETIIPINITFKEAENMDETIFRYDGKKPGASAFRSLAKELISILGLGK